MPPPLPVRKGPRLWIFPLIAAVFSAALWIPLHQFRDAVLPETIMQPLMIAAGGIVITIAGMITGLISFGSKGRTWGTFLISAITVIANGVLLAMFIAQEVHFVPKFGRAFMTQVKARSGGQTSKERVSLATRVIPQVPGPISEDSISQMLDHWADQNLRDSYDAHGKRDPKWDQDVHAMIDDAFPHWFGWPRLTMYQRRRHDGDNSSTNPAVNQRAIGKRLIEVGCDDPLFFLLEGLATGGPKKAEFLRNAADGLPKCGYPQSLVFLAQANLLRLQLPANKQPMPDAVTGCVNSLERALREKPLEEADYWFWDLQLTHEKGFDLLKTQGPKMCATVDAIPQVAEWFKHRLRGAVEIQQGWKARDHDTHSSILAAAQQTRDFRTHFGLAREELESAWKLAPHRPSISAEMMVVTGGQSATDEMRTWFDRSIADCFDYWPAYENMKWGLNDNAARLAFAKACARTERYETAIPWILVTTCQERSLNDEHDAIFADPTLWEALREVLEGSSKTPNGAQFRPYYQTELAIAAEKFHQPSACWQELSDLKFQLDRNAVSEWHILESDWIRRTSAETGPMAENVLKAEVEDDRDEQDRALADYRLAYETLKNQAADPAGAFVLRRIHKLEQQNSLRSLPWHPFMPPEKLEGWTTVKGVWAVGADGVLTGKDKATDKPEDDDDDHIESLLVNVQKVGPLFEITGEFDAPREEKAFLEAGVAFGDYNHPNALHTIQFYRAEKNKEEQGDDGVYVGNASDDGDFTKCSSVSDHNVFDIQVTEDSIIVSINGGKAVRQNIANLKFAHPAEVQVGFCSSSGNRSLHFKNVKIRTPAIKD